MGIRKSINSSEYMRMYCAIYEGTGMVEERMSTRM